MTNKTKKIFGVIVGVVLVVAAFIAISDSVNLIPEVFAQTTTTTEKGDAGGFVPCGNTAGNPCEIGHLFSTFVVIVNYLIAMAGFFAVVAIVFAGFMMVYSQGQEQLKAAKGRLSGAVIGLVLVAAAFVLINALFAGSLSIGVREGPGILSSPLDYIRNTPSSSTEATPSTTNPNTNSTTKPNTNSNTAPPKTPTKPTTGR